MADERDKKYEKTVGASYSEIKKNINIGSELLKADADTFRKLERGHLQGSNLQKHGSAAEALIENDYNRERIIKGSKERMKMSDSAIDPATDLVTKDAHGKTISRAQVKYCADAKSTMEAISKKNEYSDNDVKYVPKEQLKEVKRLAHEASEKARMKAEKCKASGDIEGYRENIEKAKRYEHTAKTAKAGSLEYDSSKEAAKNDLSRYKVMGKKAALDANAVGIKSAKKAAGVTGVVSGAQNIKAVMDGDKEIFEAVLDTSKDIAKSSAISYVTTAGGSLAKTGLDAASKKISNKATQTALSKGASNVLKKAGNNAGVIITCSIEAVKSFDRYLDGEISGTELVVELGEKGTWISASIVGSQVGGLVLGAAGGIIGNLIVPGAGAVIGAKAGAFVGEIIGGMVGYFVGTQLYSAAVQLLSYDKIKAEKRQRLIEFCSYCNVRLDDERRNLEVSIDKYFKDKNEEINTIFNMLDKATINNNYEDINKSLEDIGRLFDEDFKLQTFDEFDEFMLDDSSVLKL